MNINSLLLADFYKVCHSLQYDPLITKLVSYYTPRMSRINDWDSVPVLGIQAFVKEFLIDHFNDNFFDRYIQSIREEYSWVLDNTLGEDFYSMDKIEQLHELGYLPLEIRAFDEGMLCPIGCPMIEITNTHPDFAWLVNAIETLMSSELWYQMVVARAAIDYRKIANKWFEKTSDNPHFAKNAISEFGYRGAHSNESAMRASTGFLCSFNKTSTIPAIVRIHNYYGDELSGIAKGMPSTEHSVMCSSTAIDGNEETLIHRLLTEIYPKGSFSMVCDSYDYWNLINVILPKFKKEILNRFGTLFVRGDSGDPVDVVTKTVFDLWDIFGGTINNKGYKVLDSHIRAIYGDSITQRRAEQIYSILEENGFSAENVALGAGSFSMLCLETSYKWESQNNGRDCGHEKVELNPFTRDTFGVAVKSTAAELSDGRKIEIFKNPKTDTGHFKKSQKGACDVFWEIDNETGKEKIVFCDGLTIDKAHNDPENLLTKVFVDGKLVKNTNFQQIRSRLWNNKF